MFGYLDPLKIEQSVRIIPITRFREDILGPAEPQAFIDARVYTRDLADSSSVLWQHNLERIEDGRYIHVYKARFLVKTGHTYRLDVIRSDGIITSAETKVPGVTSDKLVLKSGPVLLTDSTVIQEVGIPDVPALWELNAIYLVEGPNYRDRVFVPYERVEAPGNDGVWRYRLGITADQDSIIARARRFMELAGTDTLPVTLTSMGIQFRIIDGAWFPLFAEEDIVRLAQPGTLSNVVNGYGLFGSMGLYREEWEVGPLLASRLGYPITIAPGL